MLSSQLTFVTSFSPSGYEQYANAMLESVKENWHPSLKLVAYYHDFDAETVAIFPQAKNIEYKNLNDIPDMLAYRERMKDHDGTEGGRVPYNWRLDAVKWCHKVYALTTQAFSMLEQDAHPGWLIWLDADTVTKRLLKPDSFTHILPAQAELVYLGRKDVDYSETSFMGFNLNYETPAFMLGDLRGAYDISEVLAYREWHDGFIFERLLKIYLAHGMKAHNLTPNVSGLSAFAQSPLADFMVHYKGNLKKNIGNDVAPDIKLPRYEQLNTLIRHYKSKNIVEVGTWNGGRAIQMATTAFENSNEVSYVGFDLFEEANEELDKIELNSKRHNTLEAINQRLASFQEHMKEQGKTFTFKLYKGDSKETLALAKDDITNVDFAYIDGGHSEATVRSDFGYLKHAPVVVFDDFFSEDENGNILDEEYLGTNRLVKSIEGKRGMVLHSTDRVKGGGHTHLAVVLMSDDVANLPSELTRMPIVVKPRDSVEKEVILDNVYENMGLIKTWDFVKKMPMNDLHAIVVSAGPSLNIPELRKTIKKYGDKAYVFCVKHSYPILIKNKIKPYTCVILDPRPLDGVSTHGKVRKDLFKDVDNDTIFFIASMTNADVTKYILSKTDNVVGWHAYSQSLKKSFDEGKLSLEDKPKIDPTTVFVTGGTCSAMRSIGMAHILGFRNFHLFGFDCNIEEGAITEEKKNDKDEQGRPKYMHVEHNDNYFWTTGELLAMAQDCERLFARDDIDVIYSFYGANTLAGSVFSTSLSNTAQTFIERSHEYGLTRNS